MLESRYEELNDFDIKRGVMRTIQKIEDRIQKDVEIIESIEDTEQIAILMEDIENNISEIKFLSSSLMFGSDIVVRISEISSVYKKYKVKGGKSNEV